MILRLAFFLMIWGACFASVIIQSPLQNQVTHRPTIEFNATSSVNRGFFMINDELVPIRKQTKKLNLPLQMGQNDLVVYVLNDELKIQPNLTQKIQVYRQLNTDGDVSGDEARVLTDLATSHYIYLVKNGDAKMDQPILKKDMFAFLMWFYTDRLPRPLQRHYHDMDTHLNYLSLFERFPNVLPMPELGGFYPNAHVTRREFINLLLLINGSSEQISTSRLVSPTLIIPRSLRHVIPESWRRPLVFVSRRDVLSAYFKLFEYKAPVPSSRLLLDWPGPLSGGGHVPLLSNFNGINASFIQVMDRFKEASYQLGLSVWSRLNDIRLSLGGPLNSRVLDGAVSDVLAVDYGKKTYDQPQMSARVIVVQKGDSIQKIARRYYGDSSKWRRLVDINQLKVRVSTVNGQVLSLVHIEPGQQLRLM